VADFRGRRWQMKSRLISQRNDTHPDSKKE
jgi:hypothetical protein